MAASSSFCHTAHARSLSVFSPRKVDGLRRKIYGMLQLAFHKVQYTSPGQAWPVHQVRPNRGVGLRRRIDGTTRRVGPCRE